MNEEFINGDGTSYEETEEVEEKKEETKEKKKKSSAPKKASKKKVEYEVVLVAPTYLVIDYNGQNRTVSKPSDQDYKIGDKILL